jgi:hypothetical protein
VDVSQCFVYKFRREMKEEFWKNMKQMERIADFGRRNFW